MSDDESREQFLVTENALRETLRFTRAMRDQIPRTSPLYAQWHAYTVQDAARLNAHLESRTTQTQLGVNQ